MFKYLPFSAGKTAHLDRLCLENSLKDSRANVGRLFVCLLEKKKKKKKTIMQTQMFCYSVCYKQFLKETEIAMITMFFFLVHCFRQM